MAELDDVAQSVRDSLNQLQGAEPMSQPEPAHTPEPAYHPPVEQGAESEVERLGRKASDLIEGKKSEPEPEQRPTTRPRDPGGRFSKKQAPTSTEFETELAAARVDEAIDKMSGKPAGIDQPPAALSGQFKAQWSELPENVRAEFVRLEEASRRGVSGLRDRMADHVAIAELVEPRAESFKQMGYKSSADALKNLVSWSDHIQKDPAGAIAHYAQQLQQRGVDIVPMIASRLGLGQGQAQLGPEQVEALVGQHQAVRDVQRYSADPIYGPGLAHPEIRQTMAAILSAGKARGLEDAHDLAIGHLLQSGRHLPDEVVGLAAARNEVQAFFKDPNNEFAEMLHPTMKRLLENGQAADLKTAYNKAMAQHSKLRQFSAAAVDLDRKKRASNASLTGAPYGGIPRPQRNEKPGTYANVVDDVRDAIAQLGG